MEATWDRIGDCGVDVTLWQCSACKLILDVKGILTPYGLGHTECPKCHAKIVGVNQNVHSIEEQE